MPRTYYHYSTKSGFARCPDKKNCQEKQHYLESTFKRVESGRPSTQEIEIWVSELKRRGKPYPASDAEFNAILSDLKPYRTWHKEILALKAKHPDLGFGNPSAKTTTAVFQLVNFLAHHPTFAFTRAQLAQVREKLTGNSSRDVIQHVNKVDQQGLEWDKYRVGNVVYYGLFSIRYTDIHLGKRATIVDKAGEEAATSRLRKWWSMMGEGEFDRGHKDPRKPLKGGNVVMQPSYINRSFRDNYIFDDNGLPRVPNPDKLAENPLSFYSSPDDLIAIFRGIGRMLPSDVIQSLAQERSEKENLRPSSEGGS